MTKDRGTVRKLRPRLFPIFVVNSLLLRSNSALLQVTPFLLCIVLNIHFKSTFLTNTKMVRIAYSIPYN